MAHNGMQPTIQDVADHAGVSRATVSRVLNNNPRVADELRERVLASVQALGYQPNRAARRLRANSSDVLGLIIPDIENPLFISIVRGVEDAAYEHQMNVVLCNTDDNPDKQRNYLEVLQAERVAGFIIVPNHEDDGGILNKVRQSGTPIVLLDRLVSDFSTDAVKADNLHGAHVAIQHLVNLGHRRIAFIAGLQYITPGQERLQGYVAAMQAAGREIDPALIMVGDFKLESGYELTRQLMTSSNPPDAIFAANGLMTMGALRALHEMSIQIPGDVALVGFDDMPWAADLNPPLTVVAQPAYDLGQQAVQLLLRRINQPDASYSVVTLQPRLIVRESCGAILQRSDG
jgi:LacI family transcriptional regulator